MSINDQVAGFGASRVFAMREDTIDRNSQQGRCRELGFENSLKIFPEFVDPAACFANQLAGLSEDWHKYSLSISGKVRKDRRSSHDNAASDRAPLSRV